MIHRGLSARRGRDKNGVAREERWSRPSPPPFPVVFDDAPHDLDNSSLDGLEQGHFDKDDLAVLETDDLVDSRRSHDVSPVRSIKREPIPIVRGPGSSAYTAPYADSPSISSDGWAERAELGTFPERVAPRNRRRYSIGRDRTRRRSVSGNNHLTASKTMVEDEDEANLHERIRTLEIQLEEAQRRFEVPPAPSAIPTHQSRTFYIVDDMYYLDEPQWTQGEREPVLRARMPIRNFGHYLDQHPEIAFAFFKFYEIKRLPVDQSKIETSDGVFKKAVPDRETLFMVADDAKDALDEFVRRVPNFEIMFPKFRVDDDFDAPYLFMYYSMDFVENICLQLSSIHARLMRLIKDNIWDDFGLQYNDADVKASRGMVTRQLMPYLVRPGDILFQPQGLQSRAYKTTSWLRHTSSQQVAGLDEEQKIDTWPAPRTQTRSQKVPPKLVMHTFSVDAWCFNFDGRFEMTDTKLAIVLYAPYDDEEIAINSLNAYPLQYASKEAQDNLKGRGRMFWNCRYSRLVTSRREGDSDLTNISDRYMVDMKTCVKLNKSLRERKALRNDLSGAVMATDDAFEDDDRLNLFPPTIHGYNLRLKGWRVLNVDQLVDVKWNKEAFEHLVVDPATKELVQALVMNQLDVEQQTDLISGKGGGLIILLHGGPGTGKTFTAEGVAEFAEKPLLRVTCGDVGTKAHDVEQYLQSCFKLGKLWDCVVLLDEADVFLEERDMKDLERNALVSVFLRILEYYQGILILTSNRVGTFDEAFKSRIQLALHYEALTDVQRRKIWRNFITRLHHMSDVDMDYDDIIDHLDELSKDPMNGREIRNSITTARQLAKYKGKKLCYLHLQQAIMVGGKFSKYLRDMNEGRSDDELKREDLIR